VGAVPGRSAAQLATACTTRESGGPSNQAMGTFMGAAVGYGNYDIGIILAAANLAVLLIRRKDEPFKGHWALPGGFVNENESLYAVVPLLVSAAMATVLFTLSRRRLRSSRHKTLPPFRAQGYWP